MKKIIIGSDHAGFELKKTVKTCLADAGWEAAALVSSGEFERGVLICGSGVGMTILANKFPGVRAVLCLDEKTARLSRMHNDTNILALAGRRTGTQQALKIITVWLDTAFEGGRHQRRIDKIRQWEEKLCRGKDMPS